MMVMGTSTAALRTQNSESIVSPYCNTRSDNDLVAYELVDESELEVCSSPSLLVEVSVAEEAAATSVLVHYQLLPWRNKKSHQTSWWIWSMPRSESDACPPSYRRDFVSDVRKGLTVCTICGTSCSRVKTIQNYYKWHLQKMLSLAKNNFWASFCLTIYSTSASKVAIFYVKFSASHI